MAFLLKNLKQNKMKRIIKRMLTVLKAVIIIEKTTTIVTSPNNKEYNKTEYFFSGFLLKGRRL